ncbi:MAG TPA: PHB depolymerase family esterase [Gammaproteobacteria bacterium]|nr:PHB depolymerase family esterase [Gammaproteobacteria bacterium]
MSIIRPYAVGVVIFILWWLAAGVVEVRAAESQIRRLSDGARERTYLIYRPALLSRQTAVPLIVMLHGGFGSGRQAENSYRWDAQADREGFVVAYPDGIGHSWNAGGICCGPALREHVDDLGFLTRLIDAVTRAENIDPRRVYLTGMSNGAAMTYRYACEGTYPLAAIGPVAGSLSFSCSRPHPVSVLAIHGLDDQHVPFAGGQGTKGVTQGSWMPVPQTLDAFRAADDCRPPAERRDGVLHTDTSNCAQGREVVLITLDGAGHQWPGAKSKSGIVQRILGLDPPSTAMDATTTLWNFFQGHVAQP